MKNQNNSIVANELLTKEDLNDFQRNLIRQLKELITKTPEDNRWLKTAEVCKMFKISHNTLLAMRLNKTIAFTRIGRNLYYKQSDLENLMLTNYNQFTKK